MRQRPRACGVVPNIKVERDAIYFGSQLVVFLRRTLRVPDVPESIEAWPLPPNLGAFPLRRVYEYRDRVPRDWSGVFVPVRAREALWLDFYARSPHAVKVGVGGVNAVTGGRWRKGLHAPQDYLVCPPQDWLDGVRTREGRVRQFVAVPLGEGYTVESQLTGEERRGGIDIVV